MKEVVSEILAAEKRVEEDLAAARQKAMTIRRESEKEVSALVTAAQEKAQALIRDTVESARKEAESIRDKAFEEARAENRRLVEQCRDRMEVVAAEIASLVMTYSPGKSES